MEHTGLDREKGFKSQIIHMESCCGHPRMWDKVESKESWQELAFSYVAVSAACPPSLSCEAAFVTGRKAQVGGSWRSSLRPLSVSHVQGRHGPSAFTPPYKGHSSVR